MILPRETLATLSLIAALTSTLTNIASAEEYRADGPLSVQFATSQMIAPVIARTGDTNFAIEFRVGRIDYLGTPALSPVTLVRNNGALPAYYASYSAFFDRDKKLVAASGGWLDRPVKPGETDYSLCIPVELTRDLISRIASYQLVVYRAAKVVGADAKDIAPPEWPAAERGAPEHFTPIQLSALKAQDEAGTVAAVTENRKGQLDLTCRFHAYPRDGWRLYAGGMVTNPTTKPAAFCYNVAFFDTDGRILGAAQEDVSSLFGPKDTWRVRQPIAMPRDRLLEVRAYQMAFYESVGGAPLTPLDRPKTSDANQEP